MSEMTFRRVTGLRLGYDIRQVDSFLKLARTSYESGSLQINSNRVRQVAFRLRRRGYSPGQVDAVLDRLEAAFSAREKQLFLRERGQTAWKEYLRARIQRAVDRLNHPPGRRFVRENWTRKGYRQADVDQLLNRILQYVQGTAPLTAEDVRSQVFRPTYRGYREDHVDLFMDEIISILLALEG